MRRHDSNDHTTLAMAHPLPLPPGATISLPFSSTRINSRDDMMPMTPRQSQWHKEKLIGCGSYQTGKIGQIRKYS